MIRNEGVRALLFEVRIRLIRLLTGHRINRHFTQYASYTHPDGSSIPLYIGYRDYLKPFHFLSHSSQEGIKRFQGQNAEKDVVIAGLGGANNIIHTIESDVGLSVSGKRVLDVGCGDGALAVVLAASGAQHVTGIELTVREEWNREYLSRLVKKVLEERGALAYEDETEILGRVSLLQKDITDLDDHNIYDLIVSNSVLEHITDLKAGLLKMRDLLGKDGIMIHVFNPFFSENGGHEWMILDFPWGHCRLTRSEIKEYLETYRGWEAERALRSFDSDFNNPRMTINEIDAFADEIGLKCLMARESRSCWWLPDSSIDCILMQAKRIYPKIQIRDLMSESVLRVWTAKTTA